VLKTNVHNLGHTRSCLQADHFLQTPDTFVRAPLPGMKNSTAIVHVGPANGARFTEYTVEMQPGGRLGPTHLQRFLFVLDGSVAAEEDALASGHFAYVPQGMAKEITATTAARLVVIEKHFSGSALPTSFVGCEARITSQALMGDAALQVRSLVPNDPEFDFAVNTMTFDPGAMLSQVEMHVMEHGLLMLEGQGVYRLGDCWYPVAAGDFIYMAPFCPQWFGALGKSQTKYLIYKDWNRHPDVR
jgi:(S)-ureidoglycine aminohydrolase